MAWNATGNETECLPGWSGVDKFALYVNSCHVPKTAELYVHVVLSVINLMVFFTCCYRVNVFHRKLQSMSLAKRRKHPARLFLTLCLNYLGAATFYIVYLALLFSGDNISKNTFLPRFIFSFAEGFMIWGISKICACWFGALPSQLMPPDSIVHKFPMQTVVKISGVYSFLTPLVTWLLPVWLPSTQRMATATCLLTLAIQVTLLSILIVFLSSKIQDVIGDVLERQGKSGSKGGDKLRSALRTTKIAKYGILLLAPPAIFFLVLLATVDIFYRNSWIFFSLVEGLAILWNLLILCFYAKPDQGSGSSATVAPTEKGSWKTTVSSEASFGSP